jgi:hypothetical protein
MVHDATSVSVGKHAELEHVQLVPPSMAQQWIPSPPGQDVARLSLSIGLSSHMHMSSIGTQMMARQSHSSAGPVGHPSGAQQRRVGWSAEVHGIALGVLPEKQEHAFTEVMYEGMHSVALFAQASLQCASTHAERD